MAVAVQQPRAREEKDPLDTILKGLAIAQGIYGIKDAGAKAEQLKAQTELQRQQAEQQSALTKKQMTQLDRQERGVLTAPEFFSKAGTIQQVDAGTPGAFQAKILKDGKEQDIYYAPIRAEKQKDPLVEELTRERLDKAKRDKEEALRAKTPEGKIEKLGAEGKNRIGMYASMLETLTDYENSFRAGERPERITSKTPLIGTFISDKPIDVATRKIVDDIGRLRSGGAINRDEEERFLAMAPRPGDTDIMSAKKLLGLRREILTKIQAYGVNEGDLPRVGFDAERIGVSGKYANLPDRGLSGGKMGQVLFNPDSKAKNGETVNLNLNNQDEFDPISYAQQKLVNKKGMAGKLPK